jgi:hypothetical protein
MFKDRGHTSSLPQGRKVMGEENFFEDPDQEGYLSLGKMLQGSFWYTVWTRSLANLETPDGFVNLVKVVLLMFADSRLKVRPQCHVNHLNNCRDRKVGHRLKLSLQSVGEGFKFLRV